MTSGSVAERATGDRADCPPRVRATPEGTIRSGRWRRWWSWPRRHNERAFKIVTAAAICALAVFIAFVVLDGSPNPRTKDTFPASAPTALVLGSVAPPFSLQNLEGGPVVALSNVAGRFTLVNFFASWCAHCQAELAALGTTARLDASRVAVIGVDTNDDQPTVARRLLLQAGARYPVGVDATALIASRYRIEALPVTYVIDAKGRVAGVVFGAQTRESLSKLIDHLDPASNR